MPVPFSEALWNAFKDKMRADELSKDDFTSEMCAMLSFFLCGSHACRRRENFCAAPYEIYSLEEKACVFLHTADDTYRFDFLLEDAQWKLAFIECVTLPIADIDTHRLPYTQFTALPQKEAEIRAEIEISRMISLYNSFKTLQGKSEALRLFCDGAGVFLCARSWVPFYLDKLAFIAYAAWIGNRIDGEAVAIEQFSETGCQLRFYDHLWRKIYESTGHLRNLIDLAEYMELFETIWIDRAKAADWNVRFLYEQTDTVLIFE